MHAELVGRVVIPFSLGHRLEAMEWFSAPQTATSQVVIPFSLGHRLEGTGYTKLRVYLQSSRNPLFIGSSVGSRCTPADFGLAD